MQLYKSVQNSRPAHAVHSFILPGLFAGISFLIIAMGVGSIATTPWAMPESIAASAGLGKTARYAFAIGPFLAGTAIHLAVSISIGALFVLTSRLFRLHRRMIVIGALTFMVIESVVSIHFVLRAVLPRPTFDYFLAALPVWAAIVGRMVFGLVLGWSIARDSALTRFREY